MSEYNEFDCSRTHIAILADTEELAVQYGSAKRSNREIVIIVLWRRAELYNLYGKAGIPFDVVPGTRVQPWHVEVVQHVMYERLVPMRDLRISDSNCNEN